jgi:hypothetical protein
MNNVIDHDRLFKELIATFFVEFIQLFFSEIINYLEPNQITFLDKEVRSQKSGASHLRDK